jgi:hypothetical protein
MELNVGQRVIVPSGPPDHGQFTGVVTGVNEVRALITPDEPALRAWFRNGYDIGRAHWPQLTPAPEGSSGLTERDLELIEVALESGIRACAPLGRPDPAIDKLAHEYQVALDHVRAMS